MNIMQILDEATERAIATEISDVLSVMKDCEVRIGNTFVTSDYTDKPFEAYDVEIKKVAKLGEYMRCSFSPREIDQISNILNGLGYELLDFSSMIHTWKGQTSLSLEISFIRRSS